MANRRKKPVENYLWITNHILNIHGLRPGPKLLLAHIYSFGVKGCWQKNDTLGKMFFRSTRTISIWIAALKKGGHIFWVSGKGYYRTLYAKAHPDVKSAKTLLYRDREIKKDKVLSGQVGSTPLRKKLPSKCADNCEVTAQKSVVPLRNKLPHTNNTTIKDTTKETATPPPLPARGQAPALLQDRRANVQVGIEQLKHGFHPFDKPKSNPPLSRAELDTRKQKLMKQGEWLKKNGTD